MKKSEKLFIDASDLAHQNFEKENTAVALNLANIKLIYQKNEKEKRAAELIIANIELAHQKNEKEKRASELVIANIELAYQNEEKEKRAAELIIANKELAHQNEEKEKRASELIIANKELAYQNKEKEKRAAELGIANKELAYQNKEKEKRAAELSIANIELAYQNEEKEKRAAELSIANIELVYQNEEKEKRAAELRIANKELAYQNNEKEKRAAELKTANIELAYQNKEKEKRAVDLIIANKELRHAENDIRKLNAELEQKVIDRTAQLEAANKELEHFASIASHDLQEPLRMVSCFLKLLDKKLEGSLDDAGKKYINFAIDGADRMRTLTTDLLKYASVGGNKEDFMLTDLAEVMQYTMRVLDEKIDKCKAVITVKQLPVIMANKTLINQVFINLVGNALKYCSDIKTEIEVGATEETDKWTFYVKDNSIGINPEDLNKIFIIFQRLHGKREYTGTGIGLAICKKIIDTHGGKIWAESEPGKGSIFYFTIPK